MKKLWSIGCAVLFAASVVAQVEVDKRIDLTGTGADAKITGIREVLNDHDAVNKRYVDSLFAVLLGSVPDTRMHFSVSTDEMAPILGQNSFSVTQSVTIALDSGYVASVALKAEGLPSGVTAAFGTPKGVPPFTSSLQFASTGSVPAGFYPVDIIGLSAAGSDTVSVTLEIITVSGKLIFQTVNKYTGNLGGLSGADAICQAEAVAAGKSGTFIALISNGSVNMKDRVTVDGIFVRPDGLTVATSKADLFDGSIANKIEINVAGGVNPTNNDGRSFTGTNSSGNTRIFSETCNAWTLGSGGFGGTGENKSLDGSVWSDGGNNCGTPTFLYCIQQ